MTGEVCKPRSRHQRRQERREACSEIVEAHVRDAWCGECGAWPRVEGRDKRTRSEECSGRQFLPGGCHEKRWDLARWCGTRERCLAVSKKLIDEQVARRQNPKPGRQKPHRLEGRPPIALHILDAAVRRPYQHHALTPV
jgi:hypothetical protein